MSRWLAIFRLRLLLEWRALRGVRDRAFGMGLATLVLLGASFVMSFGAYAALRGLVATDPQAAIVVVAALANLFGLSALLGPLFSGIVVAQSHDLAKLRHFPVASGVLALSSLAANLVQPLVLAQIPIFVAVSLALARSSILVPFTALGLSLTYALVLAAAQIGSLASHSLQRSRRYRDLALFGGLTGGLVLSLAPFVFITNPALARDVFGWVTQSGALVWLPFGWGARAAIHAGQQEYGAFGFLSAASVVAVLAATGVATMLVRGIHGGELDLGSVGGGTARRSLLRLPGVVGALVEKDVRTLRRDPALRASLVSGLVGPILLIYLLLGRGTGGSGRTALLLATFIGASGLGGGSFGFERGSLAQLLAFPTPRWKVLLAKNISASVFKVPGFLTLAVASVLLAPPAMLPSVAVIAVTALLMAAGVDAYASVRYPWTPSRPGGDPSAHSAASGAGMSRVVVTLGCFLVALLFSTPFGFLAWFPWLLGRPPLGLVTLPLSLAGALAVYAFLLAGAERLLLRREADLLERVTVDVRAGT